MAEVQDDKTPATKQDLVTLRQELKQDTAALRQEITGLRQELKQDMVHMEDRVVEQMRDMQTELLRAFHNWASPADVRLRSHEERLTLLEERVFAIERGDRPPQPH
jgi:ABC-type phosphate transport system auxiliary subunit